MQLHPHIVRLRRNCLLGHRPVHRVGKNRLSRYLGTSYGRCSKKATADFREASERRHDTLFSDKPLQPKYIHRSPVQKRLSIYNWNPGPRRGKEDAFEKQIAGRWHVITLQEASEHVDHDILTGRFHVTHNAGRAILFNKDTFYTNIDVKSIYLHDTRRDLPDQVMEGDQGWVMHGVLSRASFRRPPVSGQVTFTVLSLRISNIYAEKRGIAKKLILTISAIMIGQQIDVVAGDFNGTAWRCSNRDNISTIDEAFADCALPTPPGPTPLWGPGSISNNWADVCGFLKPPGSDRYWKVRMHGAYSIPRKIRPTDQSCHQSSPRLLGCRTLPLRYFGSLRSPMIKNVFGNELMHHCLRCGHDQNVISFIRNSSVPFPNAWNCPFQAMISCQATKNSTPQEMIFFTSWARLGEHEILVEHMVDIEKATAEFREASERKHATSSHLKSSRKRFATRSIVQRRLSIYNWNPGPRR